MSRQTDTDTRPRIGISSCLLGNEVRFDGGHKHSRYATATLGEHFEFSAYCPEVAIGLPIPRPPIRLIASSGDDALRAVRTDDPGTEFTDALREYSEKVAPECLTLSGMIVKKDSPSCGMERVKVYEPSDRHPPERRGRGIFTGTLIARHPSLPIEEEGRLMDPHLRENFITRVFARHRFLRFQAEGITPQGLVDFHRRHKFLLMAHNESGYRELGRLVSNAGSVDLKELSDQYLLLFMQTLGNRATPKQHANVLMHIMGFIKDALTSEDKQELLNLIDSHRNGMVPLIVPVTLLNHFLRRFPNEYVADQYYLEPHPRELMLRNSI